MSAYFRFVCLVVSLGLTLTQCDVIPTAGESATITSTSNEDCLVCRINRVYVTFDTKPDSEFFECTTTSDQEPDGLSEMTYPVDLPNYFEIAHWEQLVSGDYFVCIPGGKAIRAANHKNGNTSSSHVHIPANSNISLLVAETPRRKLQVIDKTIGTRSVLVARISTPSEPNEVSSEELSGAIFGLGPQAFTNSVTAQYQRCSRNQLNIVPGDIGDGRIVNGVADINLPFSLDGQSVFDIENRLTEAVQVQLSLGTLEDHFDHVIYCLPKGAVYYDEVVWNGFAELHGYKIYVQQEWCARLTLLQHEIGHNLGFRHSVKDLNGEEPNFFNQWDFTDIMSVSHQKKNGPLYCFNGQKNWVSGWFVEKQLDLTNMPSNTAWTGFLVSYLDYDVANQDNSDQFVLLKAGDIFLQFNRARGYTMGVAEHADRVTFVRGDGPNFNGLSTFLAAIGSGKRFSTDGFTFEVCSITTGSLPEYAFVSVTKGYTGVEAPCRFLKNERLPTIQQPPSVDIYKDHWISALGSHSSLSQDTRWTSINDSRCGVSELDARGFCKPTCSDARDCPLPEEFCFSVFDNRCSRSQFFRPKCTDAEKNIATALKRCGVSEFEARESCGLPCTVHADCGLLSCWPVMPNLCECTS